MIIEKRIRGDERTLLLIPSKEELAEIEAILGCHVKNGDGLIAALEGSFQVADGYGPAYLSLKVAHQDAEKEHVS